MRLALFDWLSTCIYADAPAASTPSPALRRRGGRRRRRNLPPAPLTPLSAAPASPPQGGRSVSAAAPVLLADAVPRLSPGPESGDGFPRSASPVSSVCGLFRAHGRGKCFPFRPRPLHPCHSSPALAAREYSRDVRMPVRDGAPGAVVTCGRAGEASETAPPVTAPVRDVAGSPQRRAGGGPEGRGRQPRPDGEKTSTQRARSRPGSGTPTGSPVTNAGGARGTAPHININSEGTALAPRSRIPHSASLCR